MIIQKFPLDFQWSTQEPFLFCVHHHDFYPPGQSNLGPDKKFLSGRDLGNDFATKDGFRMYHGDTVPGFPAHPHRGFETITIVRKGFIDHADSKGALARYGNGDVQWLTAGSGLQHSEMFPLIHQDKENTLELFQIWLNLPKKSKMAAPSFKMFWAEHIPQFSLDQDKVSVSLIAGSFENHQSLTPPPDSWAADPENETLILLVSLKDGGSFSLPKSRTDVNRTVYFFEGSGTLLLQNEEFKTKTGLQLESQKDAHFEAQGGAIQLLVLQSKPIGEPVVQYGPFVMNTKQEILNTVDDYRQTQFGGWPWEDNITHGNKTERFAKYSDGKLDKP